MPTCGCVSWARVEGGREGGSRWSRGFLCPPRVGSLPERLQWPQVSAQQPGSPFCFQQPSGSKSALNPQVHSTQQPTEDPPHYLVPATL